jgi:hypothetical protein
MEHCYDVAYQAENHGFLALVSPEWFDFGMDLLLFRVSLSDQEALKMKVNDAWKMARNAYLANDNIRNTFLKCASHADSILSNKEKEAVFVNLAIKVFNAHLGHELEVYNEQYTG